jgi:predicted ATP-dependent endonuclease of OLD family
MLLKKIIIHNFRSIEYLELDILDIAKCKLTTLFGINETGKSNILKAISLLNPEATLNYENDCNKSAKRHKEPIAVKFIFEPSEEEELYKILEPLNISITEKDATQPFTIEKMVSFDKSPMRLDYYLICPSTSITMTSSLEEGVDVSKLAVAPVTTENIKKYLNADLVVETTENTFLDNTIPEVLFWEPSDSYLITNQINLEQFRQNPNISIPLKHIFYLAGYNDEEIAINIATIQADADERIDFEHILSSHITNYINKIWPEHAISIKVRLEHSNFCEIYVEDKEVERQSFNMKQRSDGFKQFISILLSLSVENATNRLNNKIILLDEPERSLHPGSIRCLRDELLRISRNNIVLASSHSVFMVDKKNLDRHYTVTKEDGKTIVRRVSPENPIQDEVIYNALGTSIFELIEPNILIFEGRADKDIFDAFTRKFKDELQPSDILAISATGTKQIPRYVKFFHNKIFNGFVVVDSDSDGRNAINTIVQQDVEFEKSVFELNNLVELNKRNATLEDLFPEELVLSYARELYQINFESQNGDSILNHVKSIKKKNGIDIDGNLEQLKYKIMHQVLEDIGNEERDDLKKKYPLYIEFLTNLHSKIKGIN